MNVIPTRSKGDLERRELWPSVPECEPRSRLDWDFDHRAGRPARRLARARTRAVSAPSTGVGMILTLTSRPLGNLPAGAGGARKTSARIQSSRGTRRLGERNA